MWKLDSAARWIFLGLAAVALAGGAGGCKPPDGVQWGLRLPYEEVEAPVLDWSFAADVQEIHLETGALWGWHSVTVWCVVHDGDLFLATDSGSEDKRWVRGIEADPSGRVGIHGRAFPVEGERIQEPALWDAVVGAFRTKYGDRYENYDFPKEGDVSSGRIYRLRSKPPTTDG